MLLLFQPIAVLGVSAGNCIGFQPIGGCGSDGICGNRSETSKDESLDDMGFTGSLNGNGYTISNLIVNMNISRGDSIAGLIGKADDGALVQNIKIENANISSTSSNNDFYSYAGALVGFNDGVLRKSSSIGIVSSSASRSFSGGLIGRNEDNGDIIDSYSDASISSYGSVSYSYAGGLTGENKGTIRNSYFTGNIACLGVSSFSGGLVGRNSGIIANTYSSGNISNFGNTSTGTGGLVGYNFTGNIINSYSTSSIHSSFLPNKGGLVGINNHYITNSYFDRQTSSHF